MNQKELIKKISIETNIPKKEVICVLDSLAEIIEKTAFRGEKVTLTKLGIFKLKVKRERYGYDPNLCRKVMFPSTCDIVFESSKFIKDRTLGYFDK